MTAMDKKVIWAKKNTCPMSIEIPTRPFSGDSMSFQLLK